MTFEEAVRFVAMKGVPRGALEAALRSGEVTAGVLPTGGWAMVDPEELEAWLESQ